MKRKTIIYLSLIIISLALASCLSLNQPKPEISFYTIGQPEVEPLETTLPLTLKINRFSVSPIYNTNQMIYSSKSYTHKAYSYHKWGVNPGKMMSDYLFRSIKQSNGFMAVFPYNNSSSGAFSLNGHIDEFYELDTDDKWEAHLVMTITLISEKERDQSKKIRLQKTYSASKKCSKQNPQALAEAMSNAAAEATKEIIEDVYLELKN